MGSVGSVSTDSVLSIVNIIYDLSLRSLWKVKFHLYFKIDYEDVGLYIDVIQKLAEAPEADRKKNPGRLQLDDKNPVMRAVL